MAIATALFWRRFGKALARIVSVHDWHDFDFCIEI
jgi:hypothetical protein